MRELYRAIVGRLRVRPRRGRSRHTSGVPTRLRRALFLLHRWLGVGAGLYVLLIGLTGSAVVFRQEMQRASYPALFAPDHRATDPIADLRVVLADLETQYPGSDLAGVDWPTYRRDSFLTYLVSNGTFRTVFSHPVSGRVIGELPYDRIRWLQDLHFDLLGGQTGRRLNGLGALALTLMCLSGLALWWPGRSRWKAATRVTRGRGWLRANRDLHGAAGFWMSALLLVWGTTGVSFGFPQTFRTAVHTVLPLTAADTPASRPGPATADRLTPDDFVARARRDVPDGQPARLVWPATARAPVLLVMARAVHGDYDTSDEVWIWFDRYRGDTLRVRDQRMRSRGDAIIAWIEPLHAGAFGGWPIKVVWAGAGMSLPLLAVSGLLMWGRTRDTPLRSDRPR